jgi:hypothetical protein
MGRVLADASSVRGCRHGSAGSARRTLVLAEVKGGGILAWLLGLPAFWYRAAGGPRFAPLTVVT